MYCINISKLESKESVRLEEAIELLLEAASDGIKVAEQPDTSTNESVAEKTSLFKEDVSSTKAKEKASYVLGYKNIFAVLVNNKDFVMTNNLDEFDTTGTKVLSGLNGLLKMVGFAYAVQTKKDIKYTFSNGEISKLQGMLEKEFGTTNLAKIYNATLAKIKSGQS